MRIHSVHFIEISDLFHNYSLTSENNEYYWFECMWDLLDERGLTRYSSREDEILVYLRALSLLKLMREFGFLYDGEPLGLDGVCDYMVDIDDLFSQLELGQLCGRMGFPFFYDPDDAAIALADSLRAGMMESLADELTLPVFFNSLMVATGSFPKDEENPDPWDDEYPADSADLFWYMFTSRFEGHEPREEELPGGLAKAYRWVMAGAPALRRRGR